MKGQAPFGIRLEPVPEGFPGRADFIKSASKLSEAPHHTLPEVCFCGRSNVGKSSLINSLTNRRQLARVSSTPGRTQLINFFDVQGRVAMVDLPGYGWAKVPQSVKASWGKTIQGYLEDRLQLKLAILLVDIRRKPGVEECNLLDWFTMQDRRCLVVATKADKVPKSQRAKAIKAISKSLGVAGRDIVAFSALSKEGRESIWATILELTKPEREPQEPA